MCLESMIQVEMRRVVNEKEKHESELARVHFELERVTSQHAKAQINLEKIQEDYARKQVHNPNDPPMNPKNPPRKSLILPVCGSKRNV